MITRQHTQWVPMSVARLVSHRLLPASQPVNSSHFECTFETRRTNSGREAFVWPEQSDSVADRSHSNRAVPNRTLAIRNDLSSSPRREKAPVRASTRPGVEAER